MERLTLSQTRVDELRTEQQTLEPEYEQPAPGSALKLDDDVMWLEFAPMRIVWGHQDAGMFVGDCPDVCGEYGSSVDGHYVTDRAPADPNETPMPVWPQQAQQPQHGKKHDPKRALQHVLKQLDPEHQKKVRALVKAKKPELLDDKGG